MYNEKSHRPSYPSTARKLKVGSARPLAKERKRNNVEIVIRNRTRLFVQMFLFSISTSISFPCHSRIALSHSPNILTFEIKRTD